MVGAPLMGIEVFLPIKFFFFFDRGSWEYALSCCF